MKHTLFATVDEMLNPDVMGALGETPVKTVSCVPLHKAEAYSGSRFYRVETNDRAGPSYILKRVPPANGSAIPPLSNAINPTVSTWQYGILDQLPSGIEHAVVACSHDDAGYAILMRDMSAGLMPEGKPFTIADHTHFLDTMSALHAAFWSNSRRSEPNLEPLRSSYFFTMPGAEGWAFVENYLEPDIANVVRTLLQNPQPLYDALLRYPPTLVHNDLWWANLGIVRGEHSRVVMFDWDFATLAPPAVDLAFYIGENTGYLPVSHDAVVEAYRSRLEQRLGDRFDERWWLPQVELSFLGCFLRRGKWILLAASQSTDEQRTRLDDELAWWSNYIRRGAQRL